MVDGILAIHYWGGELVLFKGQMMHHFLSI
jgi:hypothetical protein